MNAIVVENLCKQYKKGVEKAPYKTLREVLSFPFKKQQRKNDKSFFALQDVSFEIAKGQRIGIIGRNGAGKSTLLKIISRITPPTKGKLILEGKVASLLEVGTGFHPELTGRENIFLNGAILGLKKAEIQNRLDEIIDFSGVSSFIDTPLKHFSSGMQLRLAFSVAAHLEPEILLVDEVLAVGDMEFQRKCLGKMEEVSKKDGRTILFVSHNLEAVHKFCERTILLDQGRVVKDDKTSQVISHYINQQVNNEAICFWNKDVAPGTDKLKLLGVFAHDKSQTKKSTFLITEPIGISIEYQVFETGAVFTHGLNVFNEQGLNVFDSHDNYSPDRNKKRKEGKYISTVWIPPNLLADGYFSIGVALFSQQPFDIFVHQLHVIGFTVIDELSDVSARGHFAGNYGGLLRPKLEWSTKIISDNDKT